LIFLFFSLFFVFLFFLFFFVCFFIRVGYILPSDGQGEGAGMQGEASKGKALLLPQSRHWLGAFFPFADYSFFHLPSEGFEGRRARGRPCFRRSVAFGLISLVGCFCRFVFLKGEEQGEGLAFGAFRTWSRPIGWRFFFCFSFPFLFLVCPLLFSGRKGKSQKIRKQRGGLASGELGEGEGLASFIPELPVSPSQPLGPLHCGWSNVSRLLSFPLLLLRRHGPALPAVSKGGISS
jgi:hypothetical protein